MKRIITLLLAIISTGTLVAQDFQGQATYESKTTMDTDFGGREMSEERKKQIKERMKSFLEKTFILNFNKTASTYTEEESLGTPGGQGMGRMMMGSFSAGKQYKDVKKNQLLEEKEFFGKKFLIKGDLEKLEWVLGDETRQIGNYTCFKATAIKKVDEMDFSNMRPRRGRGGNRGADTKDGDKKEDKDTVSKDSTAAKKDIMSEIDIPKEIEVTAWYTPQIPVSQGPGDFWGLPGLIIEVSSGRTTLLCSKIVMNPKEKETIEAPNKGKEVTRKEYNDIVKKKMEEMREMFRGRGRGGRGR